MKVLIIFALLFLLFSPLAASPLYLSNNLSSRWQDAQVSLLVPETQTLRNLQIRRFCSERFSSQAQTFNVNWSRGSWVRSELCGLELSVMGKCFLQSLSLSLFVFISSFSQLSEQSCSTWPVLSKELYVAIWVWSYNSCEAVCSCVCFKYALKRGGVLANKLVGL